MSDERVSVLEIHDCKTGRVEHIYTDPNTGEEVRLVTVPRKLLEEALEQIEATALVIVADAVSVRFRCTACTEESDEHHAETLRHKPDCRYVLTRDALKGLVGK